MLATLRADQVSHGSVGISFCNQLFLEPKLLVKGGAYLCLIVPGRLGLDLETLLQKASPNLKARCCEGTLTLLDPLAKRSFLRVVTCINLGENDISIAKLGPSVKIQENNNTVLWIHAYERCSPELWAELIPRQDNIARQNILSRVASILKTNATSFEAWGFRVDRHKSSLHMCIRLTSSHATGLVNSRDQFLLARPFVPKGEKPPSEEGVVILWANQIKTIPELHTISNTLLGIMGFVGNLQGVGVRVQVSHVASARALLQSPNPRITNDNKTVGGFYKYLRRGSFLSFFIPIDPCVGTPH